jgi:hypothetical protein
MSDVVPAVLVPAATTFLAVAVSATYGFSRT